MNTYENLAVAICEQACADFVRSIRNELKNGRPVPKILRNKYDMKGEKKHKIHLPKFGNEHLDMFYVYEKDLYFFWVSKGRNGYWEEVPDHDECALFFYSPYFETICPNINPDWLIRKLVEKAQSQTEEEVET